MATKISYSVIALGQAGAEAAERGFGLGNDPAAESGRGRVSVRRDFDIGSFGVNAFFQAASGGIVISEHDEIGPGANRHEELYVVVQGGCIFTVDGDEVDAPQGTALYVGDPAVKRGARSTEDRTTVLVVGGRPGEAFQLSVGEAMGDFFRLYRNEDYEGALAACREALELYPGNPLVLYNVACLEARLGHSQEALDALDESFSASSDFKEVAAGDDDLASLRDDPRFRALVG